MEALGTLVDPEVRLLPKGCAGLVAGELLVESRLPNNESERSMLTPENGTQ
jgi:hypothetical protein